jgi:hypothetical protein
VEIVLRRAYSADELVEDTCGLCECPYMPGPVFADVYGMEGAICADCLAYLHGRNPEVFPSVERLHELQAEHPTAVFESDDAVCRAETEDLDRAARLWRGCYLWTREGEGLPRAEPVRPVH